jgi:hypothetical protein
MGKSKNPFKGGSFATIEKAGKYLVNELPRLKSQGISEKQD